MRVVLDTNVVLSALLFPGGHSERLRWAWRERRCVPLISRDTAQELIRVLGYPKFRLLPEERETLLADYIPYCETVTIPRRMPRLPRCRDPHDRMFLRLAVAGKAQALVSGDADLLALKKVSTIPIMTIREFLNLVMK
jgi:uncharacterized protein